MTRKTYVLKFRTKLILVVLFLGYFLTILIRQEFEMHSQQDRIAELQQEISQVQHDNEVLSRQIAHTQSDEYIEQAARDRLGWVKEGETIYIEKNNH
jgi:cell division protein DivIC